MQQKAPNRFAQKIYDFTSDSNNANTPIRQPAVVTHMALNEELAPLGIPHVALFLGNAAQTFSSTWSIEFNPNVAFGGLSTILSDVSQEQIAEATNTMYHEGRHIEQFFKVAQLSVIEMLNKGLKLEVIKSQLVERLEMPDQVIDSAASSSVELNLDASLVKKIKL